MNVTRTPLAYALEPRFMFDAAGAATAADHADQQAAEQMVDAARSHAGNDAAQGQDHAEALATAAAAAVPPAADTATAAAQAAAPAYQEVRAADPAQNEGRKEVVFIESDLPDHQILVAGVKPGVAVVVLDAAGDGLTQMAQWAATHDGYDAIHLVSEGTVGRIDLGSVSLDSEILDTRAADLATLGSALTADGDLLLYGCNVDFRGWGSAFLNGLAARTGADVAASTNPTGASDHGGDWLLESRVGTVEGASLFQDAALSGYRHVLASYNVGTDTQFYAAITSANANVDLDTITLTADITLDAATYMGAITSNLTVNANGHTLDGGTGGSGFMNPSTNGITITLRNGTFSGFSTLLGLGTQGGPTNIHGVIQDAVVTGNRGSSSSGIVRGDFHSSGGDAGSLLIERTVFTGNTVNATGFAAIPEPGVGVVSLYGRDGDGSSVTVSNSAFYANSFTNDVDGSSNITARAASVSFRSDGTAASSLTLINNTVVGNGTGTAGTGVFRADTNGGTNSTVTVRNSIVIGHGDGETVGTIDTTGNNITAGTVDFVNAGGGDYRLASTASNAINAGNNSYASGSAADVRNLDRIRQTTVDIGAYESQFASGTAPGLDLNGGTAGNDYTKSLSAATSLSSTGTTVVASNAAITQSDSDTRISSVTLTLTGVLDTNLETLSLGSAAETTAQAAGIRISGNNTTALTLTGGALMTDFRTALRAIVYKNAQGASANTGDRSVSIIANDDLTTTRTTTLTITPQDLTPPVFDVAPSAGSTTTTSFIPSASIDEAGTIYYVLVTNNATAPSVAQVIAGQDGSGVGAAVSGSSNITQAPYTTNFGAITGLSASTAYDVYFVAVDSSGNQQAAVTKVDVTTAAPNVAPTLGDLNGDSVAWAGVGNTVVLDAATGASASDTENDNANWNGGTLTVARVSTAGTANGAWSADVFGFTGASNLSISGGRLMSNGIDIGSASNTNGTLSITFNTNATTVLVSSVVAGLTYRNDTPAGNATIRYTLADGSGGSTTANVTVTSASIYATNTTDATAVDVTAGGVSFSEALAIANAQAGADTVVFSSAFNGSMSVAQNLTVSESLTFNADSANGLTLQSSTITIGSGVIVTVSNASGSLSINSTLAGTGGLTKNGAGSLVLGGSNSGGWSGAVTVNDGTLRTDAVARMSTGALTLNGGTWGIDSAADLTFTNAIALSAGGGTVNITGNSGATILTLSGNVTGTGALTKAGSAILTLSGGTVTYSGGTTVSAGKLVGTTSTLQGNISVASGTTVEFAQSTTSSYSGIIGGGGGVIKSGSGSVTLSGANTYDGATTVSAGTLVIGNATALGSAVGGTTVASGATLSIGSALTVAENLTLAGSAALSASNASGTVTLSGTVTMTADTTVTVVNSAANLVMSNVVSGAFALTKAGVGLLTLSGDNTYSGVTTVAGGYLIAAHNNALGATGSGSATTVNSSASLRFTGGTTSGEDLILGGLGDSSNGALQASGGSGTAEVTGAISLTANTRISASLGLTLSGVISGTSGIIKANVGTLTLAGANTYSGTTEILSGAVAISAAGNIGGGAILLNGGTLESTGSSVTLTNAITLGTSSNGTVKVGSGNALTLAGVVSGTRNLTKSDSGTLTLAGINTYTGTTTIDGGTLLVTGTLNGSGATNVIVSSGTLGGTGTVNGTVTVATGARLAPGVAGINDGVGTLTFTGSLVLASGSTLAVDIAGANSHDTVAVNGTVDVTGATLSLSGSHAVAKTASGQSFIIISNDNPGAIVGTFSGLPQGGAASFNSVNLTASYTAGTGNDFRLLGPVNVAPALGGAFATAGTVSDNATATPFSGVTFTDADDATGTFTVTITYTAANGTLASGGGGLTGTAGNYTLTASSPGALQTLLRALVFTPTNNQVTPGGTVATTFTLTPSDGVTPGSGNATTLLTTTSINDAPASLALGNATVSIWDAANVTVGALSATDPDTGQTLTYALVSGAGDTNNGAFTITGTALRATDPSLLTAGPYSIRVRVSDGTATVEQTFTITVTSDLLVTTGDNTGTGGTGNQNVSDYASDVLDGGGLSLFEALYYARFGGSIVFDLTSGTAVDMSGLSMNVGDPSGSAGVTFDSDRMTTLSIGNGTLVDNKGLTVTNGTGDTLTVSSVISGASSLTKSGAGTLVLSGTNSYAGTTTVSASGGTLSVAGDGNLGGGAVTLSGGTLAVTGATTIDNAIAMAAGSTIDNSGAVTISAAISGALTKSGAGTLTLGAGNTHTSTDVTAGTLSVSTAGNLNNGTGTVTLSTGATLEVTAGITLANGISGFGTLLKSGSGTLTLNGFNNGTGVALAVTGGNVAAATGTQMVGGAITLNGGGLILSSGNFANAITLSQAATIDGGSGNVTLSGALGGSGQLTKTGAGTLTLSASTTTYSGAIVIGNGVLTAGSDNALGTTAGGTTVSSGATLRIGSGVTVADALTVSGAGYNSNGAIQVFSSGTGTVSGAVTLAAAATVYASSGTTLALNGAVGDGGNGHLLTTAGGGTLILGAAASTFTGGVRVTGATLIGGADTAFGTGTLMLSGGTLQFTAARTYANAVAVGADSSITTDAGITGTLSGDLSGSGALSKGGGAGTLVLSDTAGTSSYNGTMTVLGRVEVQKSIAANFIFGEAAASLTVDNAGAASLSGVITGLGSVTKSGAGTLTLLTGVKNWSGGLTVSAGTVATQAANQLGSGTVTMDGGNLTVTGTGITIGNAIAVSQAATITNADAITLSGVISGSSALTKAGAGTLTLFGTNTNSGGWTVSAGTLEASGGSAIADTAVVTLGASGRLKLASDETIGRLASASTTATVDLGAYTLTMGDGTASTFDGVISGTGGITKAGSAKLTLTGNNTFTGTATVSNGELELARTGGTLDDNSSVNVLNGGTLTISADESINALDGAVNATVALGSGTLRVGVTGGSGTFAGTITGTGTVTQDGSGTLTLSGSSSGQGWSTQVHQGTLSVSSDGNLGSGTVTLDGGTLIITGTTADIDNPFDIGAAGGTIEVTGAAAISGVIGGGGSGAVIKAGAGTLTLSAANSYTGDTTVSAGTLLLGGGGSLASGLVVVDTNGTLAGSGTVNGNVTVVGALAPGGAGTVGTLTVNGNLNMAGTLAIDLASASSYDQLVVSGTVTLNSASSALSVSRIGGYAATYASYTVIDNTGGGAIGSTLSGVAEGGTLTGNGDLYTTSYAAGTGNDLVLTAMLNPTVSSVSASTANGSYKAGDTVSITVAFSRAVTVTGSPTLALGNDSRTATYASGSGGTVLTFTYTVQAGDSSADLDYLSTTALSLNGGTIADASTSMAATLTLAAPGAANSLGANKAIVIDTSGPAVTAVSVPSDAIYRTGQTMDFTVTFNEAVTVAGTPTLPITLDNGEVVQATYRSGSGGTVLTFRYTVGDGKLDADGIALGAALSGGAITDAAGNSAAPALNGIAATGGVRIDSAAPTVTGVTSSTADGAYTTGDTVTVQVTFSEAVAVTGTPTLVLNSGRTVSYSGGSGSNTLTFTYVVQAGDNSIDLDAAGTGALALNGGTITDAVGNGAALALAAPGSAGSLGANTNIVVDTKAPEILGVTLPADRTYGAGQTLGFSVRLSEAVTVSGGTPTILIDVGGTQRQAVYNPAASTATILRFDYAVQAGDTDLDGIAVTALSLNGATIADVVRLPLPLPVTLTGVSGSQGVLIDTTAPDVPSAPVLAPGSDSGTSATDRVTSVTQPTLTGAAEPGSTVAVLIDGVAHGVAMAGPDGTWSFTVPAPLADGTHTLTTTATDRGGNTSPASPALVLTIDTTAPVPSTPTLAPGSDSGASAGDGMTNANQPTVGGRIDPNGSVTVYVDSIAVGTAPADATGAWSLTLGSALPDGVHQVQISVTDAAGNAGPQRSAPLTVTVDTSGPAIDVGGAAPRLAVGGTAAIGGGLTLSDASTLDRLTITLSDARTGDELVIGALPGGITAARDGNRIILSGVASVVDYQAALRALGLRSSAADPGFNGASTRSIMVSARDAAGNEGDVATLAVTVSDTVAVVPNTPMATPTTTGNANGPSSSMSSGSSSSAPSLPSGGLNEGSLGSEAWRSVTLGSIDGSSSRSNVGRSVTLASVGGRLSSSEAWRSVTLSNVGGQSSGSSSGRPGGTGLESGSGSSRSGGFGSDGGFGAGTDSLDGGTGDFSSHTAIGTGPGMDPGQTRPTGIGRPGGATDGQGQGPDPGTPPAGEKSQDGNQGGADNAPDRAAPPTSQGGGTGDRADAIPTGRAATGFAHQVARAHGGPAGASALLAALADHVLPGSRAA